MDSQSVVLSAQQSQAVQLVIVKTVLPGAVLPEVVAQLPEPLQHGYQWFTKEKYQECLALLEPLEIAWRHGLGAQVKLYQQKIIRLLDEDRAMRLASVVAKELNYNSQIADSTWLSYDHYCNPIAFQQKVWNLKQIRQYEALVPLDVLRILDFLVGQGISVANLWVGTPESSRIDPVLFVHIGCCVVSVAEWK